MSNQPPEDLLIAAHQLDREFVAKIRAPDFDGLDDENSRDWRWYVPGEVRRLWGRLDYESRVAVFVTASASAQYRRRDWMSENMMKMMAPRDAAALLAAAGGSQRVAFDAWMESWEAAERYGRWGEKLSSEGRLNLAIQIAREGKL